MLLRALRATGADPLFGDLRGAHPGVALESFFWRIVDDRRRRVVLVVCTLCRDPDGARWASVALAGDRPRRLAQRIVEDVRADTGRLALRVGDDVLVADEEGVRIDLGPDARLEVAFADAFSWPRRRHGGLGLAHLVPGLTQYWHPHLLSARVRGGELDGARVYGEKNWGRGGAPRAWWWGQGFVEEDVAFAFAGGVLDAGLLRPGGTALALRLGDDLAAFAPPLGLVRVDAGTRDFRVEARSAGWSVRLRGTARSAPLDLPVPVPAERRTLPLSHQHQDAEVEVEVRRGRRLAFRGAGRLAGFEHGGAQGTAAPASSR